MSSQLFPIPKFNLFEKKYLTSRIACLVLTALLLMYLLPLSTRGLVASIIGGGLAILLAIQFFYQSKTVNFLLGGIMFLIALYFCAAVVDEFSEFEIVTREAKQLLFFGLGLFFSIMVLSVLMIRRAILDSYE
jgi:hypothetical protein